MEIQCETIASAKELKERVEKEFARILNDWERVTKLQVNKIAIARREALIVPTIGDKPKARYLVVLDVSL